MEKVLAVISARGRSNTIPQKNIRILAGKPLVSYVIESAKASNSIDRIVVTTDHPEIALVAEQYGCDVINRPEELCGDGVSFTSIVWHAVEYLEQHGHLFDICLSIKSIAPLLRPEKIKEAIDILQNEQSVDTVISVLPEERVFWQNDGGVWSELITNQLSEIYRETGVVLAARRSVLKPESWIGDNVRGLVLEERESLNINEWDDWYLAERALTPQLKIAFVVDGDEKIGLGHIYRGLAMMGAFANRGEFIFLCSQSGGLGVELLTRSGALVQLYKDADELISMIIKMNPDIVINDILDTTAKYIGSLKDLGLFVVNFEDLGNGSLAADLVINALYDDLYLKPTHYVGPQYECLRQEFLEAPIKAITRDVKNVLITFGGIDVRNSTVQVLKALGPSLTKDMVVNVILGLGYPYLDQLEKLLANYSGIVRVHRNVSKMSKYIFDSDLVFTSAGRTVLEVMSIGTPCIVLVQNARETRHVHANSRYGIMNLGMGEEITLEKISHAFHTLVDDFSLRQEMRRRMLRVPVRDGYNRVKNLIMNNYQSFNAKSGVNQ